MRISAFTCSGLLVAACSFLYADAPGATEADEAETSVIKVMAPTGVQYYWDFSSEEEQTEEISLVPIAAPKTEEESPQKTETVRKNSFKFRAAAFYPQGEIVREIYGNFWPEGSIEYAHLISKHWAFFINGAYTRKNGHSIGERQKTTATLIPLTAGFNVKFGGASVHPYLGLGVGGAYANFSNHSNFVKKHPHYWGVASIGQIGIEFDLKERLILDIFAAYRFNWFTFNREHPHRLTGGADVGASLGFRF